MSVALTTNDVVVIAEMLTLYASPEMGVVGVTTWAVTTGRTAFEGITTVRRPFMSVVPVKVIGILEAAEAVISNVEGL